MAKSDTDSRDSADKPPVGGVHKLRSSRATNADALHAVSRAPCNVPIVLLGGDRERASAWQQSLASAGFPVQWVEHSYHDEFTGAAVVLIFDVPTATDPLIGVIRELRERGNKSHILALADGDATAVTACIDAGADAVGARCCSPNEVVARVRALVRRGPRPYPSAAWRFRDLRIDPAAHLVTKRGAPIALSPQEYALLLALARRRGCVVSRDELFATTGARARGPDSHSIETTVNMLRKKIEDDPSRPEHIVTVRGAGYSLHA
jgi:two-component system, OmpR family, response regulator MtrA